jgi:hypothetical protein
MVSRERMGSVACLIVLAIWIPAARADAVLETIRDFGMIGTWATDCADAAASRPGLMRLTVAAAGAEASYTTLSNDGGSKMTIRSVMRAAQRLLPNRLKLTLRIVGGDRDGGGMPNMVTNAMEHTFEFLADGRLQMDNREPVIFRRCPA